MSSQVRNITGTVAAILLPLMLFAFGLHISAYHLFGSAAALKKALRESGVYEVAIRDALGASQQDPDNADTARIPVGNPAVKAVIDQAIPPAYIQHEAENVIDNTFYWLHGETEDLLFRFDLEGAKDRLANGLADYTERYLAGLPACQNGEGFDMNNPLQAACAPQSLGAAAVGQKVRESILANKDFMHDPTVTIADTRNSQGKTLDQQLRLAPMLYQRIVWGVYITGILSAALGWIIVHVAATRLAGIKRIALIAMITGAVVAVLSIAAGLLLQNIITNLTVSDGLEHIRTRLLDTLQILLADVWYWWIGYGLALFALGAGTHVTLRAQSKRQQAMAASEDATHPEEPGSESTGNIPPVVQ